MAHKTLRYSLAAILAFAVIVLRCSALADGAPEARAYPEGDRIFHADARWLGGDAAISVPLSATRTLWLFGDSFIDETAPYSRADAAFVRNTVAIETGRDPRTATMRFYWRHNRDNVPTAFFSSQTDYWYWPRGGLRLKGGALYLFLDKVKAAANDLQFALDGYAIVRIANVDNEPSRWTVRIFDQPALPFDAQPGSAPILSGTHVVTLATRQSDGHAGALLRYRLRALRAGNSIAGEWWLGARGWVPTNRVGAHGPTFIIDDAGAESSVHWDARRRCFVHVASYGFGASSIGVRMAPRLTGPWSDAVTVYRPPESDALRPFVYAGKAHPEQIGAPGLLVTYVANAFDAKALLTPDGERNLYWPHFVSVPIDKLQAPTANPARAHQ